MVTASAPTLLGPPRLWRVARPYLPSLVTVVTVAAMALVTWHVGQADGETLYPLWLDLVIVAGLVASGLAARQSGRPRRAWLPLVLAGWGWVPLVLAPTANSWVFTLALVGALWWVGPLVQSIVGYPNGRLTSLPGRAAVVLAWFHGTVLQLLAVMFVIRRDVLDIPENHLKVAGSHTVFHGIDALRDVLPPTISALAILAIVLRWRRWSVGQRVRFAPVLSVSVALFTVLVAVQVASDPALVEDLLAAEQIVLALLALAFVAGFVTDLAASLAAGRLVVDSASRSSDLRSTIAETLRDPLVEVTTETGDAVDTPGRRAVALSLEDRQVGTLLVDEQIDHDPHLLAAASRLAALVLDRERLAAEAETHLAEVEASRSRIVEAVDRERHRIERNLHDGAQQRLIGIALYLGSARDGAQDPALREMLDTAIGHARSALTELRELARGLHPAVLTEAGLPAALRELARGAAVPTGVTCEGIDDHRDLGPVGVAIFYVVSEALANVAKYAEATETRISVRATDDEVVVEVADDGRGGADVGKGSGLVGLADRVAAAGGDLLVASPRGGGTTVRARFVRDHPEHG